MTRPATRTAGPYKAGQARALLAAAGMAPDAVHRVMQAADCAAGPVTDPALPAPWTAVTRGIFGYTLTRLAGREKGRR